ncbi:hypothetical protein [Rhodopila sp.]|uniref:hypothetical protein n=1 Tax=Rhodopila sp. TaxID=2480087 RepID=UPI003D132F97
MQPHPAPAKSGLAEASPLGQAMPHRLWRRLSPVLRRRTLARSAFWLARHPVADAEPVGQGIAVAGELTRVSGLGEGARRLAEAARGLGLPVWTIDTSPPMDARSEVTGWPSNRAGPKLPLPPNLPLVIHVNTPMPPPALLLGGLSRQVAS